MHGEGKTKGNVPEALGTGKDAKVAMYSNNSCGTKATAHAFTSMIDVSQGIREWWIEQVIEVGKMMALEAVRQVL